MYRQSVDPNVTEELYALKVRTAKGGGLAGLVGGLMVCGLVTVAVLWFSGDPTVTEARNYTAIGSAVLAAVTFWLQGRRVRPLRIVRHGPETKLIAAEAEIVFPLECHGLVLMLPVGRIRLPHVYLQLVDRNKRAIVLSHVRGTIYGAQPGWDDLPPLRRDVTSAQVFEVSGRETLSATRSKVEEINRQMAMDA
jgi:hypothetical protein